MSFIIYSLKLYLSDFIGVVMFFFILATFTS